MIPKEIIELAVAGGWKGWWDNSLGPVKIIDNHSNAVGWEIVALDATFWQALGKALGWENEQAKKAGVEWLEWKHWAFEFYDLILTNQPTDTFWQEIINANK